ncbi:MAG: MATE family efflux transporter [Christensenellales bacterium]
MTEKQLEKKILDGGRTLLFSNEDLKRLIIPLVIDQVLARTVGMADTMMISSVGEAAISGVSLVDMINMLINAVFAAVATGGAVIASQYLGHRDRKKACEASSQLMVVTAGLRAAVHGAVARGEKSRCFHCSSAKLTRT